MTGCIEVQRKPQKSSVLLVLHYVDTYIIIIISEFDDDTIMSIRFRIDAKGESARIARRQSSQSGSAHFTLICPSVWGVNLRASPPIGKG